MVPEAQFERPPPIHSDLCPECGIKVASTEEKERRLLYHLETAFLFTKSDFKTIIFPQSVFAIVSVISDSSMTENTHHRHRDEVLRRIPVMLLWLWIHLLIEDIANQRMPASIMEDAMNKPWRPLPSKRLSAEEARTWLVGAIIGALIMSTLLGAFTPCVSLMTLIWVYNDLDGSSSDAWLRNALNAGGLMCFSWGALQVLAQEHLLPRAIIWIFVTGAVVTTTVHAQDFPDIEGDMARGRRTMPIVYGEQVARGLFIVMDIMWSLLCPKLWDVAVGIQVAVLVVGVFMASISWMQWGQGWDEVVWKLWCLWMLCLYMLPAFGK